MLVWQVVPKTAATAESAKTLTGLVTVNNANKIATRLETYMYHSTAVGVWERFLTTVYQQLLQVSVL